MDRARGTRPRRGRRAARPWRSPPAWFPSIKTGPSERFRVQRLDSRDPAFSAAWARVCARGSDEDEAPVREAAAAIVADVRARGDAALVEYTRRFDGWDPGTADGLALGPAAFRAAFDGLPPEG